MRFVEATVNPDPSAQSPLNRHLSSAGVAVREELFSWRMSEQYVLNQLLFVIGNRDAYETALEAVPEIVGYDLYETDADRFYAYVKEERTRETISWWAAFLSHDFIHVPPIVLEDDVVRMTLVGTFDDLREVVDDLSAAVTIEIDEIGDYRGPESRITERLTARQYRALRTALERGYYEVPREGSLADVAAELDCTESTASDVLRRAEREVLRAVVSSSTPIDRRP